MRIQKRLLGSLLALAFIATAACAPKEVQPTPRTARVAVVLGAGASRGFAHIGVLKILESNGVPVHMIVGTSAGSFVGSLYAYGLNAFQLQKMALSIEKSDIIDMTIPDNGFIKGEKLENYINSIMKNTPIEKLKIPFYAVATSLPDGQRGHLRTWKHRQGGQGELFDTRGIHACKNRREDVCRRWCGKSCCS